MNWYQFAMVFGAFFVTHSVPVRPSVRAALVRRLSERGFIIAYSVFSIGMLAVVIITAGRAPFVPLWDQAPWQHVVVMIGMLGVCFILAFTIGRPNPFSFGGAHNDRFDPAQPGIVAWMRHPVLVALLIWALFHLLPNGDLAHVILFGIFASFAVLGGRLIDRRKQRQMGKDAWRNLLAATRRATPWTSRNTGATIARAAFAVISYGLLFWMHPYVICVPI